MTIVQFNSISLQSEAFDDWLECYMESPGTTRLWIGVSGYDSRSSYWLKRASEKLGYPPKIQVCVLGFTENSNNLSRLANDDYYRSIDTQPWALSSRDSDGFLDHIKSRIEHILGQNGGASLEIHVDYSCMPRSWYCRLPLFLQEVLRDDDRVFFWYTLGTYHASEYPTAGVQDFQIFSGTVSLSSNFRTHLFGLGFDRIRSQAIWSVLDPQNLICYYADPASAPEYTAKVKNDNLDILNASQHSFSVPITDFLQIYSRIRSAVLEYRRYGDVILVPDGPKPLILASSLIPLSLDEMGIACFHVTCRHRELLLPIDTQPKDNPVGFSYSIRRTRVKTTI